MELKLDDKLLDVACKVERLGTIAWVAASASFSPEKCEKILDAVCRATQKQSIEGVIQHVKIADLWE